MIKCIVCQKELRSEDFPKDDDHGGPYCWNVLYDGIIFKSLGNYGSTEYDPFEEDEYLEIGLCDKCLVERGALVQRFEQIKPQRRAKYKLVETFDQYKERLEKGDFVGRGKVKPNESSDPVS